MNRRLLVGFLTLVVVIRLFDGAISVKNLFNTQLVFLQDSPSSNTTTANTATTEDGVIDPRPDSPKGFLCFSMFGRLNNHILFTLTGVDMALKMNRTFLVPSTLASYYDIPRLAMDAFPNASYRPLHITDEPCNASATNYTYRKQFLPNDRIRDYDGQTTNLSVASMNEHDAWYWTGRPTEESYENFFSHLYLTPRLQEKAESFLHRTFPNGSFLSVHLRRLERQCNYMADDKSLCCPHVDLLLQIAKQRGIPNASEMPIFVADDRQCDAKVRDSYKAHNAIMGYTSSDCDGPECAALDFEICTHSDFFLGNLASTGDANIREWRTARQGFSGHLSVLSLKPSTVKKENNTAFTRYYMPGYFKWLNDCSSMKPRQRRKSPCIS